ncbi:DUF1492 domain-containing protein [uncultured Anaerococcus sp.]|uniref:DUF1492 domain-containing protein n=1 Tax=uncultured Anaerococcus sp. TaxID=293428 RepID=UPI0025D99253|nr:DUF1492 domain-containing protein [uncultured Anaerococcus sp.]
MNVDKKRENNKNKVRASIIKARLRNYKEDLAMLDLLKERIAIRRDKMDLQGGWSSSDAVQGGGTSQEDRLNKTIDKIRDDERTITMIELENRALRYAIKTLPDDDMRYIVNHKWIYDDMSMIDIGTKLNLSKSTAWRKSDAALLDIYKKLYILTPEDVDPR